MGRRKKTGSVVTRPCGHSDSEYAEQYDEQNCASTASRNNSRSTNAPRPRAKQPNSKKRRPPANQDSSGESLSEEDFSIPRQNKKGAKFGHKYPETGIQCKKHRRAEADDSPFMQIRTLYSKFPQDRCRLVALNVFTTLVGYLVIFPFVNFIWQYFVNVDEEVANMFHYITDEPAYLLGWSQHFRRMRWLGWPRFTAESLSLLIATAIKDTVFLHFEGVLEDLSLTNIVGSHLPKRYRR